MVCLLKTMELLLFEADCLKQAQEDLATRIF